MQLVIICWLIDDILIVHCIGEQGRPTLKTEKREEHPRTKRGNIDDEKRNHGEGAGEEETIEEGGKEARVEAHTLALLIINRGRDTALWEWRAHGATASTAESRTVHVVCTRVETFRTDISDLT